MAADTVEVVPTKSSHVDTLVDRIEPNLYHARVTLGCGLIWALDNMQIALMPFLMCEITPIFGKFITSVLAACLFLGMAFGATGWGVVSDRYGRKFATVSGLWVSLLGAAGTACSPVNAYAVGAAAFVLGLGVGGNVPVAGTLFGEFFPSHLRNKYMVWLTTIWSVGNIAGAVCAYAIFTHSWAWNIRYVQACVVPPIVVAIPLVMFTIDESPRWLAKNGRVAEALVVLDKMSKRSKMDQSMLVSLSANVHCDGDAIQNPSGPGEGSVNASGLSPRYGMTFVEQAQLLFSKQLVVKTLALLTTWLAFSMAYAMFLLWLPSTLGKALGGGGDTNPDGTPSCSLTVGLVAAAATIPGYLFAFGFLACFGAKAMMVICLAGGLATEGSYALIEHFAEPDSLTWVLMGLAALYTMLTTSAWAGLYAITTDGYPTQIRNTAFGLCSAANRVGAVVAPILGGVLPEWAPLPILAVGCLASLLIPMHSSEELERLVAAHDATMKERKDSQPGGAGSGVPVEIAVVTEN